MSGGEGGIRTHVPLRTRRFRGAPVTTTSVPLRSEWTAKVAGTFEYIPAPTGCHALPHLRADSRQVRAGIVRPLEHEAASLFCHYVQAATRRRRVTTPRLRVDAWIGQR